MGKSNLSIKKKTTLAEAKNAQFRNRPHGGPEAPKANKGLKKQKEEKKLKAEQVEWEAARKRRAQPGTKEFKEAQEELKDFHAYKRFLEANKAADAKAKAKFLREQEKKKKTSPVKPGKKLKLKRKKPGEAEA